MRGAKESVLHGSVISELNVEKEKAEDQIRISLDCYRGEDCIPSAGATCEIASLPPRSPYGGPIHGLHASEGSSKVVFGPMMVSSTGSVIRATAPPSTTVPAAHALRCFCGSRRNYKPD